MFVSLSEPSLLALFMGKVHKSRVLAKIFYVFRDHLVKKGQDDTSLCFRTGGFNIYKSFMFFSNIIIITKMNFSKCF